MAGSFLEWLGADDFEVLVAVDVNDVAIGVSRAVLLSPKEVWLHGLAYILTIDERGSATLSMTPACAGVAPEAR